MGTIAAGGVAAGIYTTNLPEACHYVSEHSKAKVIVCEGAMQLAKYIHIAPRLKALKTIVVYGEPLPASAQAKCAIPIVHIDDFLLQGNSIDDEDLAARKANQKPGNCCTLIYTSGTTGNPKAVMVSHDNLCWASETVLSTLPSVGPNDR